MTQSKAVGRGLQERFRQSHGVLSRAELLALGVTREQVATRVARGEWEALAGRLVRSRAAPDGPEQRLEIALRRAGPSAIASYGSAAWLWNIGKPPERPVLTVGRTGPGRVLGADVHRPLGPVRRCERHGFACTDPLRTLVDLAGQLSAGRLDRLLDAAIASHLVSVAALQAEAGRLQSRGRHGPVALREALGRRGFTGAPEPSALERRLLFLLAGAGIVPLGVEVHAGDEGHFRLDVQLSERLFVEVDGYAYHWSPEQMAYDARRRNRLGMSGLRVLVYTWRDVIDDGNLVLGEIRRALTLEAEGR